MAKSKVKLRIETLKKRGQSAKVNGIKQLY